MRTRLCLEEHKYLIVFSSEDWRISWPEPYWDITNPNWCQLTICGGFYANGTLWSHEKDKLFQNKKVKLYHYEVKLYHNECQTISQWRTNYITMKVNLYYNEGQTISQWRSNYIMFVALFLALTMPENVFCQIGNKTHDLGTSCLFNTRKCAT